MMDQGSVTRRKYVVSGDLRGLMRRWAEPKGFVLPGRRFFFLMEEELVKELRRIFEPRGVDVELIPFNWMQRELSKLIEDNADNLPIISLDRVYISPDSVDDYLDTTRIVRHSKHEVRWADQWRKKDEEERRFEVDGKKKRHLHGPRCGAGSITTQVERITQLQQVRDKRRIIVVDDGIWSGESLCGVEQLFALQGVVVDQFLVGIWAKAKSDESDADDEFELKAPVVAVSHWDYRQGEVFDWVCARDFFLGAPLSGKTLGEMVSEADLPNKVQREFFRGVPMVGNYGAPYMLPLGDVEKWASIPFDEIVRFSRVCLKKSRALYRAIEEQTRLANRSQRTVRVSDLERPPYFYRNKPDSPVCVEIDISLRMLDEMTL